MNEEEIIKFINEHYYDEENLQSNWLVEHNFDNKMRQGIEIELGSYISRVI